ncbi:hypothetical protein AAVH_35108, partial [Aphelenchoides avenae]
LLFFTFVLATTARPSPILPEAGGSLLDVYKRLELKLFEAEKMQDLPHANDRDSGQPSKNKQSPHENPQGYVTTHSVGNMLNILTKKHFYSGIGATTFGK